MTGLPDASGAPSPKRRRRAPALPPPEGPVARVFFRDGRKHTALHTGYMSHRFDVGRVHLILWPNQEVVYPLDVVESLILPYTPPQQAYQQPYQTPFVQPSPYVGTPTEYNARQQKVIPLKTTVKDGVPYSETTDENGNTVVVAGGFIR